MFVCVCGWGASVYTVYNDDGSGSGGDSNSVKLGKSLVNALTIVGSICIATFIVVLLYRYRCMKVVHLTAGLPPLTRYHPTAINPPPLHGGV